MIPGYPLKILNDWNMFICLGSMRNSNIWPRVLLPTGLGTVDIANSFLKLLQSHFDFIQQDSEKIYLCISLIDSLGKLASLTKWVQGNILAFCGMYSNHKAVDFSPM